MEKENRQIFCRRCDKLLVDDRTGVSEWRNSVSVRMWYSASGTWGTGRELLNYDIGEGLCDDCFAEWWAIAMLFRKWAGKDVTQPEQHRAEERRKEVGWWDKVKEFMETLEAKQ